jgi:hypothetical protein
VASRITDAQIRLINEAYAQCHTYSGAAKAARCSPSTAKKYIVNGYTPVSEGSLPEGSLSYDIRPIPMDDIVPFTTPEEIYNATMVSEEEKEELKSFWKEIAF